MTRRVWILALIVATFFSGCRKPTDPGWPVVNQITVTSEVNGSTSRQIYTSQAKMRQILNHLRDLGQKFTPFIDPDTVSARTFHIRVNFTDGSTRLYETKSGLYIRFNGGPWQQADPERIERLNQLLLTLPDDTM